MRESLKRAGRFAPARAGARFRSVYDAKQTHHIEMDRLQVEVFVVRPDADGLLRDHLYIHPLAQGQGSGAAVLPKNCSGRCTGLADSGQRAAR